MGKTAAYSQVRVLFVEIVGKNHRLALINPHSQGILPRKFVICPPLEQNSL